MICMFFYRRRGRCQGRCGEKTAKPRDVFPRISWTVKSEDGAEGIRLPEKSLGRQLSRHTAISEFICTNSPFEDCTVELFMERRTP